MLLDWLWEWTSAIFETRGNVCVSAELVNGLTVSEALTHCVDVSATVQACEDC